MALTITAQAGEPKVITLNDGSRVQGRITGIEDGRYVIDSPTLGEVRIPEDSVVSIVLPGEAAAPTQAAPSNAMTNSSQFQAVQNQIMTNPALMSEIQALMQDPTVMDAMSDPAFVQAAQSGDPEAIRSSPQLQRLMDNPKIQSIIQKLQASQPSQ